MIDRVVYKENLEAAAKAMLLNGKKKYKKHLLNRFPLKYIAKSKATKECT